MSIDQLVKSTIASAVRKASEPSRYVTSTSYMKQYEAKGEPQKMYGAPNSLIDLSQVRKASKESNLEEKLIDVEEVKKGKKKLEDPYKSIVPETEKSSRSYHLESYSLDALDFTNIKRAIPEDIAKKVQAAMTTPRYSPSEARVLAVANEKFPFLMAKPTDSKSALEYTLSMDQKQSGRNLSVSPGYSTTSAPSQNNYTLSLFGAYVPKPEDLKTYLSTNYESSKTKEKLF